MILIFVLAIAAVLLDQITKIVAVGFFVDPAAPIISGFLESAGESINVIDKVFSFTYVLNKGAAFGILENQRLFFFLSTAVICTAGIIMLFKIKKKHWLLKISSGMVLGGAIGNLIDRTVIGQVRDFLSADFVQTLTGYSFPVFNVADIFVVVGVIALAVYILFVHDKYCGKSANSSESLSCGKGNKSAGSSESANESANSSENESADNDEGVNSKGTNSGDNKGTSGAAGNDNESANREKNECI